MILWYGEEMHDPTVVKPEGCWGDHFGVECLEPATIYGLCGDCHVRITGERPVMALPPLPRRRL